MPSVISPSSFMVGNAPGGVSYAAPLMDFSPLAKLPADYYAGTQMAQNLALQQAFPNGLPTYTDANGRTQIDTNAIMQTLAKTGGGQAVGNLLPNIINQQIGAQASDDLIRLSGVSPGASPSGPAPSYGRAGSGPNAGPANIVGNQSQPQQGPVAQEGQNSIQSLTTELFGSTRNMKGFINQYSQRTGISPIAPLTPQQVQDFHAVADPIAEKLQAQAQAQQRQRPQQTPVNNEDPSSSGAPTSGTSAQERAINGGNAAPFASSGVSGSPAPSPGGTGGAPASAAGRVTPSINPATNPATAAARAIVPQQYWGREQQYAQERLGLAGLIEAQGARYAAMKDGAAIAEQFRARAAQVRAEGNQVLEALKSGAGFSPEVQQAEINKAAEQKRLEGLIAAGQKQYEGIAANARSYTDQQKGWLDTARSLFSQPELYTGVGSSMSQFINRVKAAYANDPNGAQYQAVLAKVNAASILNTINQQKNEAETSGQNSGRIFAGQIEQAEKTAPGVENTLEANRALVELQTRTGKTYSEFGRQAREYLKTHPYLDAAFDEKMSKWVEQHPLLSQAEISNPSLLGAPYVPPNRDTPQRVVAWAQAMGLKEGDPIRDATGRLTRVPRIRVPVPVQAAPQGVAPANAATP